MSNLPLVFGGLLTVAVGAGLVGLAWSTALWWGRLWAQRPWSRRWRAVQVYQRARGLVAPTRLGPSDVTDAVSALLVLGLLLCGAWEFGRAYRIQEVLDAGCAQAACYLALQRPADLAGHPADQDAAGALVRQAVASSLGDDQASQVTVVSWGSSEEVTVRAAVPWSPGLLAPLCSAGQTIAVRRSLAVPALAHQGVSLSVALRSEKRATGLSARLP